MPRRIEWTLVDSTYEHYNIWQTDTGYREAFSKGEDPNLTKRYGEYTEPVVNPKSIRYGE